MAEIVMTPETVVTNRLTYTAQAPDTSLMTGIVENNIATVIVGGGQLNVELNALPALAALVSTMAAQHPIVITPEPEVIPPEPEVIPAEPEVTPHE